MSTVDEIVVKFQADITQLQQGVARANATLDGLAAGGRRADTALGAVTRASTVVAKQSAAATSGLNSVRSSMTTLAASALSTAPGVAQLGGVIGSLALGSGVMIGVLAGMTALGYAWDHITTKAREAKRATEDALEALGKLGVQQTPAMAIQASIDVAEAELSRLEIAGDKLRQNRRRVRGPTTGIDADIAGNAAEIAAVKERIQRGQSEITALYLAEGAKLDAERLQQATDSAKRLEDARVKAARETLQKLEKLEQEFASKRSTFRTPLGEMRTGAPTAPGMVALGGVAVPNAGDQSAGLTSAGGALATLSRSAMGLVSSFSPLSLLGVALSSAFEVMQPAIDALLLPVRTLGKLVGGVVNVGLSYFAQGIGMVIKAIGWLVDKVNLFGGDGGIGKFGQEMIDAAKAARAAAKGSDELADAVSNAASSITNNPEIFDWALRRRMAGMAGGGGTSTGGPGGIVTEPGAGGGGTHFHFHNPPANLDTDRAAREIVRVVEQVSRRGGSSALSLGLRSLAPAGF